jgi:hypothetical protein
MGDRRETRRTNWRVREAVGVRKARQQRQWELVGLLSRGDESDYDRIVELLEAGTWSEDEAAH